MGGWRGRGLLGVGVLVLALGAGCARPPADAAERLATLEAEGQQLDTVLDGVEGRLLGNQARVHLWQELGRRHREVSQLHCEHSHGHLEAIAVHHAKQEERARGQRRRVATVEATVLTGAKVRSHRSN